MERPSQVARAFMCVVAWAERLNLHYSKLDNSPIYDKSIFPRAKEIEREWRAIRTELERVLTRPQNLPDFLKISADVATISHDRGWDSVLLCGYSFCSDANIMLCPETWRICRKIPDLVMVMLSIFEPRKHLPPHRRPCNGVPRLHLGLVVPTRREPLDIRVENEIYRWREGEAAILDEAYEHQAWSDAAQTRVILFVDFRKTHSLFH